MLLDMHGNIKRILRAIEAIPLHLNLDIVRFDDALGESWALPFQACSQWLEFRKVLHQVVFANQRPGFHRVTTSQFIITSVKDNSDLLPAIWESTIKPGAHISQVMLISSEEAIGDPSRSSSCNECSISLPPDAPEGYNCPKCGRWSITRNRSTNILHLATSRAAKIPPSKPNHSKGLFETESFSFPSGRAFDDGVSCFQKIHIVRSIDPVNSLEEAHALLREDSENARALQYIAWFQYSETYDNPKEPLDVQTVDQIITLLKRSISSDPRDSETWYLLGRAYMDTQQYHEAMDSYLNAIRRAYDLPCYWNSIGALYFVDGQFVNSIKALAIALNSNPYVPEFWYNLGVLYEFAKQPYDAVQAYERCLYNCQTRDPAVSQRLEYLRQVIADNTDSKAVPVPLPMRDIEIRGDSKQAKKIEHDEDIQIPALNTDKRLDSDEEWTDTDEGEDEEGEDEEGEDEEGEDEEGEDEEGEWTDTDAEQEDDDVV